VPPERLDKVPCGPEDLVGSAHGVALRAASADSSS
jgi:hypothetical protein